MRTPTLLSILALNADAYGMAIAGESKQELSDGNEGARAEQKIEVGGREKSTREGTEVAPQDIVLCVDFDYEVFECEEDEDDDEEEDSYEIGDYMSEGDEENMMLEEDWKSLQGPQKLLKAHLEKKESFSDDKEFKDMCDIGNLSRFLISVTYLTVSTCRFGNYKANNQVWRKARIDNILGEGQARLGRRIIETRYDCSVFRSITS